MPDNGRVGRLLYAIGVGLFGVALVAGVIQSLRIDGRLPALDLVEKGSKAYINLLLARKDYDGAIAQLEIQSRLTPDDAETHELLGKLLGSQGRPEQARVHFQELVRLKPKDADGYCSLGITYIDTGQPALAAPCFAEAIELNPKLSKAFHGLGVASAQMGDLAEAEKCFAKAVALAPDSVEAQNNLERARQELRLLPHGVKKGEPGMATDRPRN